MNLKQAGIFCGIAAPVIWIILILAAGFSRPEFSHSVNYISELAERGSSTEFLMRYGAFAFTGILYLCFAAALASTFQGAKLAMLAAVLIVLDGVGRIGTGVFPCDPGCEGASVSQEWHRKFAVIGFLSGVLAAIIWGVVIRRYHALSRYSVFAIASGVLALAFLLLMPWAKNSMNADGLFEHLASLLLSLWVLVFAITLMRINSLEER